MLGAEQGFGAFDRQTFQNVYHFLAFVIAAVGIAFGILVGKGRAGGFQNGFGNVVFRSDEPYDVLLAQRLFGEQFRDLRVLFGDEGVFFLHI